jgi:hypothetical protein
MTRAFAVFMFLLLVPLSRCFAGDEVALSFNSDAVQVKQQVPPLRATRSGRDDKGGSGVSICMACWLSELQIPRLRSG